ncbi:hypothetical protein N7462_000965 [Penicillium macrosclerotiorum]|uniref:uncharacterized protein n=1 Tax=Penicillium macrosclerotiorum TaxID=303699 RepID=UPI0025472316|nr:uncharacterized protein N7462_000965 [Penicillium macrosclerotiorum]KAJ5698960.1 hypothetical protein N7462_000965 [Penicillium macrosclerotiorum]
MGLKSRFLLSLLGSSVLTIAEEVGYFEDSSICADSKGLATCYKSAATSYASCIANNCSGGSKECYNSCNGDASCMATQCPNLGIDCINACGCVQSVNQIDCIASSCWNQVYSCEYQRTVEDVLNLCAKTDMDQLPFWPPPDDAPARCSCNLGKIDRKENLISAHLTQCVNNETNLAQFSTVDEITDYSRACTCCAMSGFVTAIWGTCPNTKPSDLGADAWYSALLEPNDWEDCGPYLASYDCAGDLGYGSDDAGDTTEFYKPNSLPANGTETMYNTGGVLSTPVSGATFTWTYGTVLHAVTAVSTDNVVTATGTGGGSGSTATQTGASATKTGAAVSYRSPSCLLLGFTAVLALALA